MILLSGVSTMPRAPASCSRGSRSRTKDSSTITKMSTQDGSTSGEIVGLPASGSSASTASASFFCTFIERPTRVAAAIECLHNASLHHDDAIDGHSSRRGVTTALAQHGFAAPVLAGDGLVGIGLRLLGTAPDLDCRLIVEYLGTAWHRMTQGQAMDEPAAWKTVPTEKHEQHWELMTRSKLALGNVAAPLASATVGRRDIVKSVAQLHERFSVASQIMNDIGDLEGWEGFHTIGPSTRKRCEEACRKPTIATIWSRASEDDVGGMALGRRALQQVSLLTSEALKELSGFSLQSPAADTLQDFFIRPLREMERVARGHTPC